jgi:hypothetical protein
MPPELPPLTEWETFYVIIGSSAAALTGLQFVVIALGAEARVLGGEPEMKAFGTPTIVHFCVVLLLGAILSTPGHTPASLSLCLGACGLGGLGYACRVVVHARRQQGYAPVLSDWVWHAGLPLTAYAGLLAAGVTTWWRPAPALYVVAATALMLLFIGIHNAWDAAVWMAIKRKES